MSESSRDQQLLEAVQAGHNEALGELYDRHAPGLMPVALRFLRCRRDAEDLLHDVFVEAWQNVGSYDASRGSVRGWLAMRLRSRAIDRLRALKKAAQFAMFLRADESRPQDVADGGALGADGARARRALRSLPTAQREVIELGYFRGLTCSEISMRCGIPLGTVKSRLSGAMAKLKRQLVNNLESG